MGVVNQFEQVVPVEQWFTSSENDKFVLVFVCLFDKVTSLVNVQAVLYPWAAVGTAVQAFGGALQRNQ
jgi:hypothetical protein